MEIKHDNRRWLWAAAIAARHAADEDGSYRVFGVRPASAKRNKVKPGTWDEPSSSCEAARFLYYRYWHGLEAVEMMRQACRAEGDAGSGCYFPQPPGFRGWEALAEDLFAELGVDASPAKVSALGVGDKGNWSVYHLEICRAKGDPLHDPSGDKQPEAGFVGTIRSYGSVFTALCVVVRDGKLVVSDGRQRINSVRQLNEAELYRYYEAVEGALRPNKAQRELLPEAADIEGIEPPHLIHGVPFVVVPLEKGRVVKAVANAARKQETVLEQVRACWDLADAFKADKVPEDQIANRIAAARGCSKVTAYNFLKVRELIKHWLGLFEQGRISACTAYTLGGLDKARQGEVWKALEAAKAKNYLLGYGKVDKWIEQYLDGGAAAVAPPVSSKQKGVVYDRTWRLREVLLETPPHELDALGAQLLTVLNVVGGDEGSVDEEAASEAMPPRWRAAIFGRTWTGVANAEAWQAAGVVDPRTVEDLTEEFKANGYDEGLDWEGNYQSAIEQEKTLIVTRATQPWPADPSRSVAWAYEHRRITLDEAGELMNPREREDVAAGDEPGLRETMSELAGEFHGQGGRAPFASPRYTAALNALASDDEDDEPPQPTVVRASAKRGPAKPWKGFTDDERAAYEAAGVRSRNHAAILRKEGFPLPFLEGRFLDRDKMPTRPIEVLGEAEAVGTRIGGLFAAGLLSLDEVRHAHGGAYGPVGLPVDGAAMPTAIPAAGDAGLEVNP